MKLAYTTRFYIGFAIFLLVVISFSANFYAISDESQRTSELVSHSGNVLIQIGKLHRAVQSIDAVEHSLVITSNTESVLNIRPLIEEASGHTAKLRTLIAGNTALVRNADSLQSLLLQRSDFSKELASIVKTDGLETAVAKVRSGGGSRLSAMIHSRLDSMNQAESKLLSVRNTVVKENESAEVFMLNSSLVLIFAITFLLFVSIRKYPALAEKLHKESEQIIHEKTSGLTSQNHELLLQLSEQMKVEQVIKASEERYRSTLDSMLEGCQIIGFDWEYLYINDTAAVHNRRPKEELLGKKYMAMWPGVESTQVFQKMKTCMEERIPQSLENVFTFPDGRMGCFDLKIEPIKEGIFILSIDITHQVNILQAIRQSEEKFRKLVENADEIFYQVLLDDDPMGGKVISVSPKAKALTGYDYNVFLDRKELWATLIHPDDKLRVIEATQKVIESRVAGIREYRIFSTDGQYHWITDYITPMYDVLENLIGYQGIARDITDYKHAEAELIKSESLFHALFEASPDAIILVNKSGGIITTNRQAQILFDYSQNEMSGKTIEFLIPERFKNHKEKRQEYTADPKSRPMGEGLQLFAKRKDGTEFQIEIALSPIGGDNNESIIATIRDITEKKRLENQFLRMQRMESIGTLAGGIAHDLNNIFAPIMLSLHFIGEKLVDDRSKRMFEMLNSSVNRGTELIKQVLGFARGIEGEFAIVQIRHLVDDILKMVNETFPKSVTMVTKLPTSLPTINADATQIHQVLMNLSVNARDAMLPLGGEIRIEGEVVFIDEQYVQMHIDAKVGHYVCISVTDQGTGMPPAVLERIFEPFFTTKQIGDGTGLGLSTVAAIMKSHHGFINVYSEVGKGTTFRMHFPILEGTQPTVVKDNSEVMLGSGETILVVDDEDNIREITKLTLETHGYNVITATDGTEALTAFALHGKQIALVITDMMMPHLDGTSTIRALRKMNQNIKIIAVSGLMQNATIKEYENVVFLSKPYTSEKLIKTIGELLGKN